MDKVLKYNRENLLHLFMSFICVASFLVAFRLILIIHAPHSQAQATGIPIPWIYPEQRPGWLYRCAAPPTHTCPHVHVWRRGAVPDIHGLRGHLQKINMVKLHPQTRSHKEVSIFILDSMLDCIISSHLVVHILKSLFDSTFLSQMATHYSDLVCLCAPS